MNKSIQKNFPGKIFFCLLIFAGRIGIANCQVNDAQLWENISLTKKLNRNLMLHFNHEGRISNNVADFYYAYGDIGITRNLNKKFRIELDYVLVWKNTYKRISWRHQWYTAVMYKDKFFKRIEFGFRSMYQQQFQDIYSSEVGRYPENYLRNKITLTYLFHTYPFYRFAPYVATEVYYHLDNNNKYGEGFDRMRYFAGTYYDLNKRNTLELYYLIEKHFNINDPPTNYVLGVGYEHNF